MTIFLCINTTPIERHLTFTLVFLSTQASATEIFLAAVLPGFQYAHNCVYTLHMYAFYRTLHVLGGKDEGYQFRHHSRSV